MSDTSDTRITIPSCETVIRVDTEGHVTCITCVTSRSRWFRS